jgi:uncharacterized damage-inducible protein DinB
MGESDRIAEELRRAYDGDAWHGPSVREALAGVDARMAAVRPAVGSHTIQEILLHMTSWTREVARRLRTGLAQEPEDGDWPPPAPLDETSWAAIQAALEVAQAELVAGVSVLDDEALERTIGDVRDRATGSGVSRRVTLYGLLQHHAYHAGQIALLKKGSQPWPAD